MTTIDLSTARWRKSSHSNAEAECVEIADLDGGCRAGRDSKNPAGPALIVVLAEWAAFTNGIRNGDFG